MSGPPPNGLPGAGCSDRFNGRVTFRVGKHRITPPAVTLIVEGEAPIVSPPLSRLRAAVECMSYSGGPECIIIEGHDAYAFAAGSEGRYTAEWHEATPDGFQHWVAGRRGHAGSVTIVRARPFDLKVKMTECLTVSEVLAILEAFRSGQSRPARFVWREVTQGFF